MRRAVGHRAGRSGATFARLLVCLALVGSTTSACTTETAPPIVVVVFDELPTHSLLDAEGDIDAALVPHFAELAATSTWARGASTVATRVLESVPALLTGRMPPPQRTLAIRAEYPESLFTWLEGEYALHVREPQSLLGPTRLDAEGQARWLNEVRNDRYEGLDQVEVLDAFLGEMVQREAGREGSRKPTLDFIHLTLPYAPWRYAASGRTYQPRRFVGNVGGVWVEDETPIEDAWRRHLAEVRLADAMLGRLVETLEQTGRFSESLVVVTATYGAGFWPGESRRTASATAHPEDVLLVPLFVKVPGQTKGGVSDAVVHSIDVLPTLVDVLGRAAPFAMEGCSLFDASCERPTEREAMRLDGSPQARTIDRYPADLHHRRATLERKHALFPDVAHVDRSWPAGRFDDWIGAAVGEVDVVAAEPSGTWAFDRSARDWLRAKRSGPRFVGTVDLGEAAEDAPPPWIAIALNGRLEAIAPATPDRRRGLVVRAMLPEAGLRPRGNVLALYVVREDDEGARLEPLAQQRRSRKRAKASARAR